MEKIKTTSKNIKLFVQLGEKTGLPPYTFMIGSIVILFFLLLTSLENILQNLILIAYPLILTYRHLGKESSNNKEKAEKTVQPDSKVASDQDIMAESKAILLFWAASGSFFLIDKILCIIVGGSLFYNLAKIGLLVWMVYPGSTLPKKMVDHIISPVMSNYGSSIDQFLDIIKKTAEESISKINEAKNKIQEQVKEKGSQLLADEIKQKLN